MNRKALKPYQFFQIHFEAMLEEGKRQEKLLQANHGEEKINRDIHDYFTDHVFPLIDNNEWVYEALEKIFIPSIDRLLISYKHTGSLTLEVQERQYSLLQKNIDIYAKAYIQGATKHKELMELIGPKEIFDEIIPAKLPDGLLFQYNYLKMQAHELMVEKSFLTAENIRDLYETFLPRIMVVVNRVITVENKINLLINCDTLVDVSGLLDWYKKHIHDAHPLAIIFNEEILRQYKIIRNVASHKNGISQDTDSDSVIIQDQKEEDRLVLRNYQFTQMYRYLLYFCEFGFRGLLWKFTERNQDHQADDLLYAYAKVFPNHFEAEEKANIIFHDKDSYTKYKNYFIKE